MRIVKEREEQHLAQKTKQIKTDMTQAQRRRIFYLLAPAVQSDCH